MKKLSIFLAVAAAALALQANPEGYFMLSLISPGQLPTQESNIYGARLSAIYGNCQNLYGLDVGVSGHVHERIDGLQVGALFSIDDAEMNGLGIGCVHYVGGVLAGCQIGLWNHATRGAGAQIGLVNTSAAFTGVQIGLLNHTRDLGGVQIGLSNYKGPRPVAWLPLVNIGW